MESNMLPVVEDFYTLQGEGRQAGRAAYFIRIGGCDVGCRWCDAKFTWGADKFPPTPISEIVDRAASYAAQSIVITGGEPTLYELGPLTEALHERSMEIFLETSGTNPIRGHFDWICLSPKRQQPPLADNFLVADELKVIVETVADIEWAEKCAAKTRKGCLLYLQAEWSRRNEISQTIIQYIMANPKWRISLQSHKYLNIP